jgi:transposase
LGEVEIVARVERRRKWSEAEKAALLAEVEAEGGKVLVVVRRHGIAESLLYTWRSARKTAAAAATPMPVGFVPIGVVGRGDDGSPALLPPPEVPQMERPERRERAGRTGLIELELPTGARLRVDALVNEAALARVLRAMKRAT